MSGRVIMVSGYFNPIHSGHLDYLEAAKKQCDYLIVIVNSDEQVKLKGSDPFMGEAERLRLVRALRCVNRAVISIDEDGTVCQSIRKEFYCLNNDPFVQGVSFANGGDRKEGGVPEDSLELELGIRMLYNIGGEKTQSSSTLLYKSKTRGS
tara:strand:+ start:3000 stop:3452 length:453 start_codon:yes stop_codon:yes gene_type:complete